MTIEQHAEAAVREYWDAANNPDGHGKAMTHYIAKHMQAAVTEATAPLRARIAELEGLGPLITEFGLHLEMFGRHGDQRNLNVAIKAKNEIDAILKGGAS